MGLCVPQRWMKQRITVRLGDLRLEIHLIEKIHIEVMLHLDSGITKGINDDVHLTNRGRLICSFQPSFKEQTRTS